MKYILTVRPNFHLSLHVGALMVPLKHEFSVGIREAESGILPLTRALQLWLQSN